MQGISVEELSVEQFRRKCVEPMGEESDEVHIVALTDVLQVGPGFSWANPARVQGQDMAVFCTL